MKVVSEAHIPRGRLRSEGQGEVPGSLLFRAAGRSVTVPLLEAPSGHAWGWHLHFRNRRLSGARGRKASPGLRGDALWTRCSQLARVFSATTPLKEVGGAYICGCCRGCAQGGVWLVLREAGHYAALQGVTCRCPSGKEQLVWRCRPLPLAPPSPLPCSLSLSLHSSGGPFLSTGSYLKC